jgi:cell volume regulation protein A
VTGLIAHWLLDFSVLEGLLLGSIVASSDSAAIFSVLRGSSVKRRLARTLEAESGLNDPIAVLLVLGFIEWIKQPDYGLADMALLLVGEISIGLVVGLAVGTAAVYAFRRVSFASTGLYPVASIATAALAYGGADVLHGSGFLAVYLAGLALGSARVPARRTVEDFHAGLAWVAQIALFLTLGLLVFPSDLDEVALEGLLIAGVLILVARPIATFAATSFSRFKPRETLLLSWAGLRGAIPVVLATFPATEGFASGEQIFDLVFFVVLSSTLLQGSTVEPLARRLRLTGDEPAMPRPLVEVGTIRRLGAEVVEYPVAEDDAIVGRVVNQLGLPREALVSVIVRDDQALLPRGSTEIAGGDRLHILVREPVRASVESLFEHWRSGARLAAEEEPEVALQSRAAIFTVRPWREADGDPDRVQEIDSVSVARSLRTRRGASGALVQLADGRYAAIGEGIVAVGGPRQLFRYCRERIRRASDAEGRAWWQEVAGALSQRALR